MIIPMEILSLMSKTDSGQSPGRNTAPGFDNGKRFEQVLEQSQANQKPQVTKIKTPEDKSVDADVNTEKVTEKQPKEDSDEAAQMAGKMGISEIVVFILEGNNESVTLPETNETEVITDAPVISETEHELPTLGLETTPKPENVDKQQTPEPVITAEDVKSAEQATKPPETSAAPESKAAAAEPFAKTLKPENTQVTEEEKLNTDEILARKPVLRTREFSQAENNEQGSKFSENGSPCPFENENEETPKVKKEKPFTETLESPRNRETTTQPANNTAIPISDNINTERFQATQQMKQVVFEPVAKENLFDEMISRIETAQTESRQTMTIQLKPEFLGKVALEVAVDAAGLHVKINAADAGVRGMINSQVTALIESLENKGIQVAEVDIAYPSISDGEFKDPKEGHDQGTGRSKRGRQTGKIENADYNIMFMSDIQEHYLDIGMSTVEYSA